jgi:zinc transporter ZupT
VPLGRLILVVAGSHHRCVLAADLGAVRVDGMIPTSSLLPIGVPLVRTTGMRLASRSSTYVLSLWSGIALGTAAATALAFYFLSDLVPHATGILKAYGGALIAMAAETMIPEAFHNGPRYSGLLAAAGFAALILFGELAR